MFFTILMRNLCMQTDTCFLYQSQYKTCKMNATQLFKNLQPITHILTLFFAWKQFFSIDKGHGLDECAKNKTEWTDYNCHICFWLEFYWNIKYTHDVAFQYDKKYKKGLLFPSLSQHIPPPICSLASEPKSKFRYKMHRVWIQQEGHNFTLKWIEQKLLIRFWEVYLESILVLIFFFARSSETTLQQTEQPIPSRNFSDRIRMFCFRFFWVNKLVLQMGYRHPNKIQPNISENYSKYEIVNTQWKWIVIPLKL